MTTALEGGEGSASCPGRSVPSGKTRYPLYRRLGGPQDRSGQVRKISPPPGFDPRTVQPVASRYTDYATRPTFSWDPTGKSRASALTLVITGSFYFMSIKIKHSHLKIWCCMIWVTGIVNNMLQINKWRDSLFFYDVFHTGSRRNKNAVQNVTSSYFKTY